jgi:hypothetical protein
MGQVAKRICTAIRARCGAAALFDLEVLAMVSRISVTKKIGNPPDLDLTILKPTS